MTPEGLYCRRHPRQRLVGGSCRQRRWFVRPQAVLLMLVLGTVPAAGTVVVDVDVFSGGNEGPQGTPFYRIPGMTVAADGSLLAFAEGRRTGGDPGQGGAPIDLVYKRSTDGGQSWSPLTILEANSAFDYDDPTPVLDRHTGRLHLLYGRVPDNCGLFCVPAGTDSNSMNTFVVTSDDHGQSWSPPRNITAEVKDPAWRGIVPGPGSGIQLRWQADPARNGRLVVPGSINANRNLVFFSDDGGELWQHGNLAQDDLELSGFDGNENEVVELTNGNLLMNARQNGGSRRRMFLSDDGGATWDDAYSGNFPITTVDASMIRHSARRDGDDRDRLLFSGPSGSPIGSGSGRSNITVWTSYDEGQTFTNPVVMADGFAAYSVLNRLEDGSIGLLYEATGLTRVRYLNFNTPHLEGDYHPPSLRQFEGWNNLVDPFLGGVGWSGGWSTANVAIADGSLDPLPFAVIADQKRATFRGGHMSRSLAQPLDLDADTTHYISIFVRAEADGFDGATDEWLDVRLLSGNDQQFSFGVTSDEAFFVRNGNTASSISSPTDTVLAGGTYLAVAKIEAQPGAGFDQISLAYFDDLTQVPDDESQVDWTIVGALGQVSDRQVDGLWIGGGINADWSVDALRVGSDYSGVVVRNGLTGVEGDINQDGVLDLQDRDAFVQNWRGSGYETLSEMIRHGDFSQDGVTNLPDAFVLHEAFQNAGFDLRFDQLFVPEPHAPLWAVCCATFVIYRRRCPHRGMAP